MILDYISIVYLICLVAAVVALINKDYSFSFGFFMFSVKSLTAANTASWFFISWTVLAFFVSLFYIVYKVNKKWFFTRSKNTATPTKTAK